MSSTPANVGTDISEPYVGQSLIVPAFQGHPKNYILIAVISFSETGRN